MRTRADKISRFEVNGHVVERDEYGYLLDPEQWDEDVAALLAAEEGITLGDEHWSVLRFMRSYLDEHGIAADARFVYAHMAKRRDETPAEAKHRFFTLFPYGYVKQACKIAGMRQPRAWSTG